MDLKKAIDKLKSGQQKFFSIISGEKPRAKVTAKKPLEHSLKEAGYKYHKMKGKYGGETENSYLVESPDHKHIERLAQDHGQDSVVHSDGKNHRMVYTTGKNAGTHHKGQGIKFHDKVPKDNYSKLGDHHFTLNFDMDTHHKND